VQFALREEMENQVKDMVDKGVIEPSSSNWAAPAILVPKKSPDCTPNYQFCVDFRALNAITQFDTYPYPCSKRPFRPSTAVGIFLSWTVLVGFGK
jgi:hypothetical protein